MASPSYSLPFRSNNADRGTELCQAAAKGNLAEISRLLDAGTSVNAKELNTDWTALHRAAQQGHKSVVLHLLRNGANAVANGPRGLQPLHIAISTHDASIARILLENGAIRSLELAPTGATPFHLAVATGSKELVELLLEKGANPQATVQGHAGLGETAVHMAVASWNGDLIPLLLSKGLDVNAAGQKPAGQTALHIAAWYGYEEAAQTLLDAGANVNAPYGDGQTALHRAAAEGHYKMVELLIERGADPMAGDTAAYTPLCAAAAEGKIKCLDLFLDKFIVDMTEEQKGRVLISAAAADKTESVVMLMQHGVSIDARYDSVSGLEIAALYGVEKMVIFLLKKWPSTESGQQSKIRATQWANMKGQVRIARIIEGMIVPPETSVRNDLIDGDSMAWTLAADSTYRSRRRIMANPNASGLPSIRCRECFDLNFRRGRPKDVEIMHYVKGASVAANAGNGCEGCTMIRKCLEHMASVYKDRSFIAPNTYITIQSMVHGGPLYVTVGNGPSLEIYTHPGSPTIWPAVGIARETSSLPWSDRRKAHLQSFVQDCLKGHSRCSYTASKLPTRVIDVGVDERDEPRLHISNSQVASYVALSHCWGGSSPMTTTSSTLAARKQGVPMKDLPKTFKEAVEVTRALGVRYLWIDSICIIQDSAMDWERESLNMRNVYANCYVMIAADGSNSCHGGIFPETIKGKTFSIPADGPGGRKSKVYYRSSNILQDDQGEVCHRLHDTQSVFKPRALDTRGWTLQERILAPRTIHFDKSEIGWECAERRACECQIVPTQLDTDSRFKNLLINTSKSREGREGEDKRWFWSNIVEEFTHRNLTKYTDTLPALSGLASFMSSNAASEYVCGLWRNKLSGFLMWQVDYTHIRNHHLTDMPRRHESYHAPSWSWASVIGPVHYTGLGGRTLFSDGKGWDTPYPLSKGESDWAEIPALKILDVQVVPQGLNPFGPPKSALLTVSGEVAEAFFEPRPKELPNMSSNNGGLLIHDSTKTPLVLADFNPDILDTYRETRSGDRVLLLFMSESKTPEEGFRKLSNGKVELVSRIAFGKGLVLKLVAGQLEKTYLRVGTFHYQGADKWEKWRGVRHESVVHII